MRSRLKVCWVVVIGALLALAGPMLEARAELVMKVLVVNPSETEVKEFDIRSPLPPEVKPEHVLDADGLKVDYDSQAGAFVLVGSVTLKPKESITKRVLLEDVWVIEPERFTALRREVHDVLEKLKGTPYDGRGQLLASVITRQIDEVEESQGQPLFHPVQHINRYREDVKKLQMAESDLVSLRQLMVMAALNPKAETSPALPGAGAGEAAKAGVTEKGGLSILTTWRIIFMILAFLGVISLWFFLVWQQQLKRELAKQATREAVASSPETLLEFGNGKHAADAGAPPVTPRLQPKSPLS